MDSDPPRMSRPSLRLTPHGLLVFEQSEFAPEIEARIAERLSGAFARGVGYGLLQLGAGEVGQSLPPLFLWWRGFASRYVASLCLQSSGASDVAAPTQSELASLVLTAPMMAGAEYLTPDALLALWQEIAAAIALSRCRGENRLQSFLKALNPAWNLVGRVHFNLAENRRDAEAPFAFMATYTTHSRRRPRHSICRSARPCANTPARRTANGCCRCWCRCSAPPEKCAWLKPMIDAGEIFHPLRWTPQEASRFLASVPDLESAGVVVRMPAAWRASRPPRPQVTGTVGTRKPSGLGLDGMLDFHMEVTLDGETLSEREIATLLAGTDPWCCCVANGSRSTANGCSAPCGSSATPKNWPRGWPDFAEAMRMLAGAALADSERT